MLKYQILIVVILVSVFFNFTIKEWRKNVIDIIAISIISIGSLQLLRCKNKKSVNTPKNLKDQNNFVN